MKYWRVPLGSQTSPRTCWEACARMMWAWRWLNVPAKLRGYAELAGATAKLDRGLDEAELIKFYERLGMRSLRRAKGSNVRYALAWTPVIITSVYQTGGHAMIASGHRSNLYTIIDPIGNQTIDFTGGGDSQAVTETYQTQSGIDRVLGPTIWYW